MAHWSLDNLPWESFDRIKVDPKLLAQAKGASLVESNAAHYVDYLLQVFAGDEKISKEFVTWGEEERLHGAALRRWCEMADPSFDFNAAMARFQSVYHVPVPAAARAGGGNANAAGTAVSVRGSRARELVARCVVETGTTTYYSALRDSAEEPLLKEICRRIAGDEVRHFNLFLKNLREKYAELDGLNRWGRLKTIVSRMNEVDDPELTCAYFCANSEEPMDMSRFREYSRRYMAETVGYYRERHFQTVVPFLGKAAGLALNPRLCQSLGRLVHGIFQWRYA